MRSFASQRRLALSLRISIPDPTGARTRRSSARAWASSSSYAPSSSVRPAAPEEARSLGAELPRELHGASRTRRVQPDLEAKHVEVDLHARLRLGRRLDRQKR